MNSTKLFKLFLCLLFTSTLQAQTAKVSGTFKQWHKIEVAVNLPGASLSENSTTFKNHRLDVIFTDASGRKTRVPGFFAADNDAANSSASSGKIFKAYLRPENTGTYKYEALYYKQSNAAILQVNQLGSPTYRVTGTVGNITASDKRSPDLRSKGRLRYQTTGNKNQKRYLRFQGNGEYFLKLGPDSPENLLNYFAFDVDGNRPNCGRCTPHEFAPHGSNYKSGDVTWKNGRGKNLIGALNYLKDQKMNAISMSLFGGDDISVYPWSKLSDKNTFDVSKLAQWELVFDHAEKNGLLLHFKLAENENWDALSANEIRLYYREMVARFGHHLAVEWNISEEYRGTAASAIDRINWLASIDPWQNHRVIHTYPGEHKKYKDWLSLDAKLTGASIQTSNANNYNGAFDGNDGILTWINNSEKNNTPWVVTSDEQNSGEKGVFTSSSITNSSVVSEARTKVLWKTLIAGGAGVMWYGGSEGDFKTENFNRFSTLFSWSRYAIQDFFLKNKIAFWNTENRDDLVTNSTVHCLAEKGKTYVVYLENGGTTNLNLAGELKDFTVKWFNPRSGGNLQNGSKTLIKGGNSVGIGNPPSGGGDWVALITAKSGSTTNSQPVAESCKANFVEKDGRVIIEAENLNISGTSWKKKTAKGGSTGSGYITWEGTNNFGKPSSQKVTATIEIKNPGKYKFQWRNNFGKGSITTEHNDSWLRFPDASSFYAVRGNSKVYPIGSGKKPNAAKGGGYDGWFKVWLTGNGKWSWYSKTWDSNSHDIYVEFDKPGIYTMEISGRSQYHEIDRIMLAKDGVDGENLSLAESVCEEGTTKPTAPAPTKANNPPTLSINFRNGKTAYKVGETADMTMSASDDGRIEKVEIFVNNTLIKTERNAPYTAAYKFPREGTFGIKAIAFDDKGRTTTKTVDVKATNVETTKPAVNQKPSVSLSKISNGQTIPNRKPVKIGANATDDGRITKVVFYAKGVIELGTDTSAPFETTFIPALTGDYKITAKAYDDKGASTTSSALTLKVRDAAPPISNTNQAPKVLLRKIRNGGRYKLGTPIPIEAEASDIDGSIRTVEFFAKGVISLGVETRAPYEVNFTPAFAGSYKITAKATDNNGKVTISPSFTIHVDAVSATLQPATIQNSTIQKEEKTESLSVIQDAYLDNNTRINNSELRVEGSRRESYFIFDVSSIKSDISEASLQLAVGSDSGNGTLSVYSGSHTSWSETNLTGSNKPKKGKLMGSLKGNFASGTNVNIRLSPADIKSGKVSLILTHGSGNDVAFASKEHTSLLAPQLVIKYSGVANKTAVESLSGADLKVYPNPTVSDVSVEINNTSQTTISLYTVTGIKVKEIEAIGLVTNVDLSDLATGVYIAKALVGNKLLSERIIKQ